jgi:hypothetical protein
VSQGIHGKNQGEKFMSIADIKRDVDQWVDKCIALRKKFDQSKEGTEATFKGEIKKLHNEHDELQTKLNAEVDPKVKEIEGDLKLYDGDLEAMEDYIEKKAMTASIVRLALKKAKSNMASST